jgi:hypothetical protein
MNMLKRAAATSIFCVLDECDEDPPSYLPAREPLPPRRHDPSPDDDYHVEWDATTSFPVSIDVEHRTKRRP